MGLDLCDIRVWKCIIVRIELKFTPNVCFNFHNPRKNNWHLVLLVDFWFTLQVRFVGNLICILDFVKWKRERWELEQVVNDGRREKKVCGVWRVRFDG